MPLFVMKIAVQQDWRAVRRLMQDNPSREDVIEVVNVNSYVVQHPVLACTHYAVLAAAEIDGMVLEYASPKLQANNEITMAAVSQNWKALMFCSKERQNTRSLVDRAFKQSGLALQYASEELRSDSHCVIEAMKHDVSAFKFAAPRLQVDSKFWEKATRRIHGSQRLWLQLRMEGKFGKRHLQTLSLPAIPGADIKLKPEVSVPFVKSRSLASL